MSKLCECGCGEPAPIAGKTHRRSGHVKGEPVRFIAGHRGRRDGQASPDYFAVHNYLRRHFPKAGICDKCGAVAPTEHALRHGHEHSRERENYLELCRSCHMRYDNIGANAPRGERNPKAKLTAEIARDIRRRRALGETYSSLAARYHVRGGTIWAVITGKTWREVM